MACVIEDDVSPSEDAGARRRRTPRSAVFGICERRFPLGMMNYELKITNQPIFLVLYVGLVISLMSKCHEFDSATIQIRQCCILIGRRDYDLACRSVLTQDDLPMFVHARAH